MYITTFDIVVFIIEVIVYTFHFSLFWLLIVQRNQRFKGAVYDLFRIIFVADFMFWFMKLQTKLPSTGIWPEMYKANGWLATVWFNGSGYFVFLQFFAHTLIAFNRFTLFWFPTIYTKIWSRQWYTVFVVIMPIIGLSHRLTEPGVFQYAATGEVIVKLVNAYAVSATYGVSSALYFICTAIQASFNILAMMKYNNYKQHHTAKENDKRLLYISFIFFVLQLFRSVFNYIRPYFADNIDAAYLLQLMVPIIADVYAWSNSLSLIFLSPSTRKAYVAYFAILFGVPVVLPESTVSTIQKVTISNSKTKVPHLTTIRVA